MKCKIERKTYPQTRHQGLFQGHVLRGQLNNKFEGCMSSLTAQVQHRHFFRLLRLEQFREMTRTRTEIEDGREFSLYVLVSVSAMSYERLHRIDTSHKSLYHPVGHVIANVVNCPAAISPVASRCTVLLQALGVSVKDLKWASSSGIDLRG